MAKYGVFERFHFIIEKLKKDSYTSTELSKAFQKEKADLITNKQDDKLGISSKSMIRDIKDLMDLGFEIEQDKKTKKYSLKKQDKEALRKEVFLEKIAFLNEITRDKEFINYIEFERQDHTQKKFFSEILKACKLHLQVQFAYQSFFSSEPKICNAEPYLLKSFRNRWYMIAKDLNKNLIYPFSLDRFHSFNILDQTFENPYFDATDFYTNCFGIIKPHYDEGQEPQEVLLDFEEHQGRYVEALPLHHSQKVILRTENTIRVSLKIYITYDFVQELLYFRENVKVIEPLELREEINQIATQITSYYGKKDVPVNRIWN